jgi:hypothetical protein
MDDTNNTCDDLIIGAILGCTSGVPGCMQSEHNPHCLYSCNHSPQNNKYSQQFTSKRMLSGKAILDLVGYKTVACEKFLKVDPLISDDDFVHLWTDFVLSTQQKADAIPNYGEFQGSLFPLQ